MIDLLSRLHDRVRRRRARWSSGQVQASHMWGIHEPDSWHHSAMASRTRSRRAMELPCQASQRGAASSLRVVYLW